MTEVEFEHRRIKPGVVPPSLETANRKAEELGQTMSRRARVWRVGIVIAGAASIAWSSQRLGLEFGQALCLFLGALPVLWVGGWLFGFLFTFITYARKQNGEIKARVGSSGWQQELEKVTVVERVKVSIIADGLQVVRDGASQLVPFGALKVDRVDASTLAVYLLNEVSGLALNEALPVPRSAFTSNEAFDAFCLELQKHVWEAQR